MIGTCWHALVHWRGSPISRSTVHGSPSSGQAVGQVDGGSQVSPAWIRPSLQVAAQSASVAAVQPAGQQPSPLKQAVIAPWVQVRVHAATEPAATSTVQASPSLQLAGQAPGNPAVIARSHASPISTTPSPHTVRGQSASVAAVQPGGQQ